MARTIGGNSCGTYMVCKEKKKKKGRKGKAGVFRKNTKLRKKEKRGTLQRT